VVAKLPSGLALLTLMTMANPAAAQAAPADGPWLWLDAVQGDAARVWSRKRNAASRAHIEGWPPFAATRTRLHEILHVHALIPKVVYRARTSATSGLRYVLDGRDTAVDGCLQHCVRDDLGLGDFEFLGLLRNLLVDERRAHESRADPNLDTSSSSRLAVKCR
jgi:hypothetical protein